MVPVVHLHSLLQLLSPGIDVEGEYLLRSSDMVPDSYGFLWVFSDAVFTPGYHTVLQVT